MTRAHQLETAARNLLERYARIYAASPQADHGQDLTRDVSQIEWLLPQLALLVEQHADQPVDNLRPEFRNLILEHLFVDECGDHCVDHSETAHINYMINLITKLLRESRRTVRMEDRQYSETFASQLFG